MIDQIKQVDGYDEMTPAQISQALAVKVSKPESFYSFNGVVVALDNNVQLVESMIAAMRSSGLNASADSLTNKGIDFGLERVLSMIDSLGNAVPSVFTPEVISKLKDLGLQTRFASFGGVGEVPTEAEVSAALIRDEIEPIWQAKQAVVNEGIFNGTITSLEEIMSSIGGN